MQNRDLHKMQYCAIEYLFWKLILNNILIKSECRILSECCFRDEFIFRDSHYISRSETYTGNCLNSRTTISSESIIIYTRAFVADRNLPRQLLVRPLTNSRLERKQNNLVRLLSLRALRNYFFYENNNRRFPETGN